MEEIMWPITRKLLGVFPILAGLGLVIYFIMDKPPAPAAIETELTPAQEQALFGA